MYTAIKHSHLLSAALSVVLTLLWTALTWRAARATGGDTLAGRAKAVYIGHRAAAGLAGVSGLAITFVGPWQTLGYPYVGLAAFIVHGFAAGVSRRTLAATHDSRRRAALLVQIAALALAAYVMSTKSF